MMSYVVRPMGRQDVAQVTDIDREAFPTMWPPMNYHRELENQLACYLVLTGEAALPGTEDAVPTDTGLAQRVKRWLSPHDEHQGKIIGFAGFWIMAGESHIISLAVKKEHRRQGLGQLLLMEIIEEAIKRHSENVTLEVRVSNYEAQHLYLKHGFVGKGVRRAYYTDNREDALILTLDDVASAECRNKLDAARAAMGIEG